MNDDFKWRHFTGEIILHCVRWYCKYGISYRDLQEMMEERGISVDHTTLYRWVQTYAPEIEKRLRWHRRGGDLDGSWRVDETYIKIKGEWKYLYRAVNARGRTIEFYLSNTRNVSAATIFLKKAPASYHHDGQKPDLRGCDCQYQCWKKGGRTATAPHGQISQQHCRS